MANNNWLDHCPCCGTELKIGLTKHALERLDERLYLKYFRNFRLGEDQTKWLFRISLEALHQGKKYSSRYPGIVMQWWCGVMFVFKDTGSKFLLITLYPRSTPKKNQLVAVPEDVAKHLEGFES